MKMESGRHVSWQNLDYELLILPLTGKMVLSNISSLN